MTLKPLLHRLHLQDDDPVGRELRVARDRALEAALASFADDESTIANAVRQELTAQLTHERAAGSAGNDIRVARNELHGCALAAARKAVHDMRASEEIGDDAFHQMEEELDWIEMSGSGRKEGGAR